MTQRCLEVGQRWVAMVPMDDLGNAVCWKGGALAFQALQDTTRPSLTIDFKCHSEHLVRAEENSCAQCCCFLSKRRQLAL